MHAASMAETICPACLIVKVQILETQIECPNYLDNQIVVLISFMGTFSHFFFPCRLAAFYISESYDVISKIYSAP